MHRMQLRLQRTFEGKKDASCMYVWQRELQACTTRAAILCSKLSQTQGHWRLLPSMQSDTACTAAGRRHPSTDSL